MTPENQALLDNAMKTLGWVTHRAALADAFLYEAFHALSGCDRQTSRAIYFTADALQTRRVMARRVADAKGVDNETKDLLENLGEAVKKVAGQRNDLAHSLFVLKTDEDWELRVHRVNPKRQSNATTSINDAGLEHSERQSRELLAQAHQAFEAICRKLGIQPELGF